MLDIGTIKTLSQAKINLLLRIGGRRPDGYHPLSTIFLPLAEPCDTVSMSPAPRLEAICLDGSAPSGEDNICFRAVAEYAEYAATRGLAAPEDLRAWRVALEKRIPVAAGLGGGSSNAACVLLSLNQRYQLLGERELRGLAAKLGADVPFFLDPRPAAGGGVGDELTPIEMAEGGAPLALVSPGFPVSAAWAYRALDQRREAAGQIAADPEPIPAAMLAALRQGEWGTLAKFVGNDFHELLFEKFPLLRLLAEVMLAAGALVVEVSGSGPTLFALCGDDAGAKLAAAALAREFPSVKSWATRAGATPPKLHP